MTVKNNWEEEWPNVKINNGVDDSGEANASEKIAGVRRQMCKTSASKELITASLENPIRLCHIISQNRDEVFTIKDKRPKTHSLTETSKANGLL